MSRPKNIDARGKKLRGNARVDTAGLPVTSFIAIDCSKPAFAHLRTTGKHFITLASKATPSYHD
jgi:hypothetical protein